MSLGTGRQFTAVNGSQSGRWYDPALGRPLQPKPVDGPPILPQALNRYAAMAPDQPGVYATTYSGYWSGVCQNKG